MITSSWWLGVSSFVISLTASGGTPSVMKVLWLLQKLWRKWIISKRYSKLAYNGHYCQYLLYTIASLLYSPHAFYVSVCHCLGVVNDHSWISTHSIHGNCYGEVGRRALRAAKAQAGIVIGWVAASPLILIRPCMYIIQKLSVLIPSFISDSYSPKVDDC